MDINEINNNKKPAKRKFNENIFVTSSETISKNLVTIDALIKNGSFNEAKILLDKVLEAEPNNSEALYLQYYIYNRAKNNFDLNVVLTNINFEAYFVNIDFVLNNVEKSKAIELLNILKEALVNKSNGLSSYHPNYQVENELYNLFTYINSFEIDIPKDLIKYMLDISIKNHIYIRLFNYAISLLDNDDKSIYLESYINLYYKVKSGPINSTYIFNNVNFDSLNSEENSVGISNCYLKFKEYIIDQIKKVDDSISIIYRDLYDQDKNILHVEEDLKNSKDLNDYINRLQYYQNLTCKNFDDTYETLLSFIPKEGVKYKLDSLISRYNFIKLYCINKSNNNRFNYLDKIKLLLEQIIELGGQTPERLYEMYLYNHNAFTNDDLINYSVILDEEKDFLEIFSSFSFEQQQQLLAVIKKQKILKVEKEKIAVKESGNKNKKKKTIIITSAIFTLVIVLGFIFIPILTKNKEDKNYVSNEENVVIPDGITSIDDGAFENYDKIKTIVIPESVTYIGDNAFKNCISLETVVLPQNLKYLGTRAFKDCKNLKSIVINENIETIEFGILEGCNSLESLTLPFVDNGVYEDLFIGYYFGLDSSSLHYRIPISLKIVNITKMNLLDPSAFSGCEYIEEVTIPEGCVKIGDNAFAKCSNLKKCNISNTVLTIGQSAFEGCTDLEEIIIPNSVTRLGQSCFNTCTKLNNVVIPNSIEIIPVKAFYSCWGMKNITLPESLKEIQNNAFYACVGLKEINLPSNLEKISNYVFANCRYLEKIVIPNSVTEIGEHAFFACDKLKSVTLSENIESLSDYLFAECSSIQKIVIPEGCKSIGNYTFYKCHSLKEITFPSSLNRIGLSAFYNCTSFTEFVIPENVKHIGKGAFQGCMNITTITLPCIGSPANSSEYFGFIFGANNYAQHQNFVPIKLTKVVITNDETIANYCFYGCKYIEVIELNDDITTIGKEAFHSCSNLKEVNLPKNLTKLNDSTFYNCVKLTSIVLPSNLESIGNYVFNNCSSLTKIIIPESVLEIGTNVFRDCSNIEIYCEISSIPYGWRETWNPNNRPVYWGC